MKEDQKQVPKSKTPNPNTARITKMLLIGIIMTGVVLLIQFVFLIISSERQDLDFEATEITSMNYGGIVEQSAPRLNALGTDSDYYDYYNLTPSKADEAVQNANLKSTEADVTIIADFNKRALRYEPTFRTNFSSIYKLVNNSNEEAILQFEFPFPSNVENKEISNARLFVDNVEIDNPVRRAAENIQVLVSDYYEETQSKSGLYWEGKVDPNSEKSIKVTYDTVGLSRFSYIGLENSAGSQNFLMRMKIIGSRDYDNEGVLSIDEKNYITEDGKNGIELVWNKPNLFSKPEVQVVVASKVNPAQLLSNIYWLMTPLYIIFIGIIGGIAIIKKKNFGGVDLLIISLLFIVFFPFLHYLASFTIDPSVEIFSSVSKALDFSMPLYGAFIITLLVIGSLIIYHLARVSGVKFAFGIGLPSIVLFLGFFPLAVTIPEYKGLLVLIGIIVILALIVQARSMKSLTRKV